MSQRMDNVMEQPHAESALRALEVLVGEWILEAKSPDGQLWPGEGRATFEWHPSRAHLVQRTVIDAPDAPGTTSIIGCDAANGRYSQLYSDERGVCRIYAMAINGSHWTLERHGRPFSQRFSGRISDDRQTISGSWEKSENGADFTTDFYLTYYKVPRLRS